MYPNAEVDAAGLRKRRVGFGQGTVSLHGTPDGINRAAKLRQHAVARCVGDTAPMRRNQPVQDFPARGEGVKGSDFIGTHEAAIALNVSRKDSRQPAFHFNRIGQG
jgi:hypothetical protein